MGGEGWLENAKEKRVARQWRTRGLPFPVWEPRGASPTAQHGSSPPSLYYGNFLAEELFAGRKRIRYRFLPSLSRLQILDTAVTAVGTQGEILLVSRFFFLKSFHEKNSFRFSPATSFLLPSRSRTDFDSSRENKGKREKERERDRQKDIIARARGHYHVEC